MATAQNSSNGHVSHVICFSLIFCLVEHWQMEGKDADLWASGLPWRLDSGRCFYFSGSRFSVIQTQTIKLALKGFCFTVFFLIYIVYVSLIYLNNAKQMVIFKDLVWKSWQHPDMLLSRTVQLLSLIHSKRKQDHPANTQLNLMCYNLMTHQLPSPSQNWILDWNPFGKNPVGNK